MDYNRLYTLIIQNARRRFISTAHTRKAWNKEYKLLFSDYIEIHHITPKCIGGIDHSLNFCALSAKEHYIAHRLLCKIYPTNSKLWYAYNMLSTYTKTSREYQLIKEKCSEFNTGVNNPFYQKSHTVDSKITMIQTNILKGNAKPLMFNGELYLSIRCASKLLSCTKRALAKHVNSNTYNSKYLESLDVPNYIWQLNPSASQIKQYTNMYKDLINTTKQRINQIKVSESIQLLESYISSDCNSLDEYAIKIGMSDCGLAYKFKRFPQYKAISNGCKQFTKNKAIELLNSIKE
jgi:hypothetical protein